VRLWLPPCASDRGRARRPRALPTGGQGRPAGHTPVCSAAFRRPWAHPSHSYRALSRDCLLCTCCAIRRRVVRPVDTRRGASQAACASGVAVGDGRYRTIRDSLDRWLSPAGRVQGRCQCAAHAGRVAGAPLPRSRPPICAVRTPLLGWCRRRQSVKRTLTASSHLEDSADAGVPGWVGSRVIGTVVTSSLFCANAAATQVGPGMQAAHWRPCAGSAGASASIHWSSALLLTTIFAGARRERHPPYSTGPLRGGLLLRSSTHLHPDLPKALCGSCEWALHERRPRVCLGGPPVVAGPSSPQALGVAACRAARRVLFAKTTPCSPIWPVADWTAVGTGPFSPHLSPELLILDDCGSRD